MTIERAIRKARCNIGQAIVWAVQALPPRALESFLIKSVPLALIWTFSTYHLTNTFSEMVSAAETETSQTALDFEQNIRRIVNEVDRTIGYLREFHAQFGGQQSWPRILQMELFKSDMVAQIGVTDSRGAMISSSGMLYPKESIDLSDRDHVRTHLSDNSDKLFISIPVLGRVSGRWTVQFSRPYFNNARVFEGVVVVSLNVDYLERTYRGLHLQEGSGIALFGPDGIIRAGRGVYADQFGKPVPAEALKLAATGKASVQTAFSALVGGSPVAVAVLRDLGDISLRILFDNRSVAAEYLWRKKAHYSLFAAVSLSLGSLILTSFYLSRRRNYDEKLNFLAYFDPLTGLPNRRRFLQILRARCEQGKEERELFLFFIDIDRLKRINDRHGQAAGDTVLKQFAERLRQLFTCWHADVARLGGDEFAVVFDAPHDKQLDTICESALALLRVPFQYERQFLRAQCSIGAARLSVAADSKATLIRAANFALLEAKQRGGNCCQTFDEQLSLRIDREMTLEAELAQALEDRALDVHYQRIVCANTRRVTGYEALVRWQKVDGTFVPPSEFVPIAESRGLIAELDRFVIDRVFSEARRLIVRPDIGVAINISARELRDSKIAEFLNSCAERYNVSPANIRVEITETAILDDMEIALRELRRIKDMGFQILLDDFGTCYASLSNLLTFPVSGLKIDQSFVRDINSDARDRVIVSAMVHIARGLNLRVVAEGVENEREAKRLSRMGVDHLQGYLFGRPAPIGKVLLEQVA